MVELVVSGTARGFVKPKQVAPLLDRIEQSLGGPAGHKHLGPMVHIGVGDALSALPVPVPYEALGAYALALGDMVTHKQGSADQVLTTLERLDKVLLSVRDTFDLSRIDSFKFLLTPAGLESAEHMFSGNAEAHKRFCTAMAIALELQGIVGKHAVELYIKARIGTVTAMPDAPAYFAESVKLGLDAVTFAHLIRCAIKINDMPHAMQMSEHLVGLEPPK